MLQPEPGTWYVIVTCDQCTSTVFLFADLTRGRSKLDARYIVTCPHCAHKGGYLAQHYYHSPELQQMSMGDSLAAASEATLDPGGTDWGERLALPLFVASHFKAESKREWLLRLKSHYASLFYRGLQEL